MNVTKTKCKSCGAPLMWLNGFTTRPVEADARPIYDGCTAVTFDRRSRALRWVDTLAAPPPVANHVHYCGAWRDNPSDGTLTPLGTVL